MDQTNDLFAIQRLRPVRHSGTYRIRRQASLKVAAVASVIRHLGHMKSWLECNEKDAEGWRLHCGMVSQIEEVLYQTRAVYPSSVAAHQLDRARTELQHLRAALRSQKEDRSQLITRHILSILNSIPG